MVHSSSQNWEVGVGRGVQNLRKGIPKLKKNYYSSLKAKAFQQFSQQNPYNTLKWLECRL